MMKKWLKKFKGQQGTTLVELLVAVAIVGLIVPGLFAAFQVFIKVPAQLSATLASIGSISQASDWISKDVSVAQSVSRSSEPGYVTLTYIDEDDQEHVVVYSYVSDEKSIIRQDTIGGSSTTLTVATGVEEYSRADLNVVTFKTGVSAPVDMVVGNLLATHYAGADPREKEASPYAIVRHNSQEAVVGKVFSLLYMGAGNLTVNGWTLYYRDLHVNGNINFSGGTNTVYGNTSAGGDISFSGSTNMILDGDIRANGLVKLSGQPVAFAGDVSAGEVQFQSHGHSVEGILHANGDVTIGNNNEIGQEDAGNHIPGDITSLGTISMGTGNTIHGQLIQKDGDLDDIDLDNNTVWGDPKTYIDSTLEALDPLPTYPSPIATDIAMLIAGADPVFYFSGDVVLTNVTEDDYGRGIWDDPNEELNDGVYYAPNGKITMSIAKNGDPISGKVTFIAQQIDLGQHPQWADGDWTGDQYDGDPSYTLSAYTQGILFWATGTGNNVIEMTGLNGLSLQGIVYAPTPGAEVRLLGKEYTSEFILSTGSSIAGDEITLQGAAGSGGVLKFTSIELEPVEDAAGETVTVSGLGFRNNSPIDIDFGEYLDIVFFLFADADGKLSTTFTVPGGAAVGFHTVRATDEDGNWAAAFFKVTP